MSSSGRWRRGEVVAWTEHDSLGLPPRGPGRVAPMILAGSLAVLLTGMMSYDTLCTEHQHWVVLLGVLGFMGTAAAIAGLVQARALAPLFTVFVSVTGVSIGLIDAVHDPTRGRLIALLFGATALVGAVFTARAVPLALWDRRVRRRLGLPPLPPDEAAPAVEPVVADGEPTSSATG